MGWNIRQIIDKNTNEKKRVCWAGENKQSAKQVMNLKFLRLTNNKWQLK